MPPLERVLICHHTHMDIGYTDLPAEVLHQHLLHLDRAVSLCRENSDRPPEERYYWTCESALLVREYLDSRPVAHQRELLNALREGWIELQAFLTQPLTELCTAEELIDCLAYAVHLGQEEGFEVRCGMIDDIGGYAGRLPTVMSDLGIPYLVAGVGAFQVHLPWAQLPHLFYWRDTGGNRILVWNLGIDRDLTPRQMTDLAAVYGQGALQLTLPFSKALGIGDVRGVEVDLERNERLAGARDQFGTFEDRLQRENYPYRELLLQYGGDNRGPDPEIAHLIQAINQRTDMPKIELTTPTPFFRFMEKHYAERIPEISGVMTDPWILRASPQPATLKANREAQRLLTAAEARLALSPAPPRAEDRTLARQVRDQNLFVSDHTCGLSEWKWQETFDRVGRCRDETFDRFRESWAANQLYADRARSDARRLDHRVRGRLAATLASKGAQVVAWNQSPAPAQGLVEIYTGRDGPSLSRLTDPETGEEIPLQQVGNHRYAFLSPPIPAFGCRVLPAEFGRLQPVGTPVDSSLKIKVSPEGELISLNVAGNEYLAPGDSAFAELIYHQWENIPHLGVQAGMSRDWQPIRIPSVSKGSRQSSGPVFREIVTQALIKAPGGDIHFTRTIRIPHALSQINVRFRLDKPERAQKESIHIAFPFAGDGDIGFDQNLGQIHPTTDLVEGAMQDIFYANSRIWMRSTAGTATLHCPDAPVFSLGRIRLGEWEDELPFKVDNNAVYSLVYHNLLNTDCPIWRDILDDFNYNILLDEAGADPLASGTDLCAELLGTSLVAAASSPPYIKVSAGSRILSLTPGIEDSDLIFLLLENQQNRSQTATIETQVPLPAAWRTTIDGRIGEGLPTADGRVNLALAPNEVARIALRRF